MNTEKSLAPYVAQFVPLKVDTATAEFGALNRKHRAEGNSIPIVFLIRADGQKLYAKSGSLRGDQLPTLLGEAIRQMGRPLAKPEVQILERINAEIEKALADGKYRQAIAQFAKLKKLGDFGKIGSYAEAALENNALAQQLTSKIKNQVSELISKLDSEEKLVASIQALQLKDQVDSLGDLRGTLKDMEKEVRSKLESPDAWSEIKSVAISAGKLEHRSEKVRLRAAGILQQFVDQSQDEKAANFVSSLIEESGISPESIPKPEALRLWRSLDGKFSVKAKLIKIEANQVVLNKESGQSISVPIERLSKKDQEFIRSMRNENAARR